MAGPLGEYLRSHIPLADAMGVEVVEATSDLVVLRAPLAPNLNHRDTAFGGSVAALAILAGWTAIHVRLRAEGKTCRTVVQRSSVAYLAPVDDAFEARVRAPDAEAWRRFRRTLGRWGRARMRLEVEVHSAGALVARFDGDYVSLDGAGGGAAPSPGESPASAARVGPSTS